MQILDIILIIPFLWFCFKGLTNGLLKEIFSTLALIIGLYLAIHFSTYVGNMLNQWMNTQTPYFKLICFALTFILALLAMKLGIWFTDQFLSKIGIGWLNKIGGLAFGLLKGAFIVGVIIYFLNSFDKNNVLIEKDTKDKSLLYKPLSNFVTTVYPSLHQLIALKIKN